jgi:hypothetical protein
MILLWAFIVAAAVLPLAAGAQAVALLRTKDTRIARLYGDVAAMQNDTQQLHNQLDATRILLKQAQEWIRAKATQEAATEAQTHASPSPPAPAQPEPSPQPTAPQ